MTTGHTQMYSDFILYFLEVDMLRINHGLVRVFREMTMADRPFKSLGIKSWIEAEAASSEKLVWVVPLATAVATTANVILYFIITRWFHIDILIGGEEAEFWWQPPVGNSETILWQLPVSDIILFSVVFASAAGIVFVIVPQLAQRPIRTYLKIATVALFLSLYRYD
ncbi:MAG: hypothetical protein KJ069_20895 [Anaerolineae bacterium]|nr:hypothetical protein [Anaerolineae bacterium]